VVDVSERDPFWIPDTPPKKAEPKRGDDNFVDLIIHEDYVILVGKKIERVKAAGNLDKKTWVIQWNFLKERLAARGSIRDANKPQKSNMEIFRECLNRSWEDDR
jgi:hypothetical protein